MSFRGRIVRYSAVKDSAVQYSTVEYFMVLQGGDVSKLTVSTQFFNLD